MRLPAHPVFLGLGLCSALFVGMIDPVVAVYYVRVVGLGPLELVLLGTVVEIAGLVCEVPTGIVADLYSRRLSVIIGVLAVGACFLIQGLVPVLAVIVLAEALRGIGATFTSGALEAWIAGVTLFGLAASFELAVVGYVSAEVLRRVSGPLFTGWVNRHVDPRIRATLLSMGGEVDAIGQLSGGPAIGVVGQLFGLRAAMVAVGVTLLPALPLLARARRQAVTEGARSERGD